MFVIFNRRSLTILGRIANSNSNSSRTAWSRACCRSATRPFCGGTQCVLMQLSTGCGIRLPWPCARGCPGNPPRWPWRTIITSMATRATIVTTTLKGSISTIGKTESTIYNCCHVMCTWVFPLCGRYRTLKWQHTIDSNRLPLYFALVVSAIKAYSS